MDNDKLTCEQRDAVRALRGQGKGISYISTKLGLTREYVQAYVRYLNSQG